MVARLEALIRIAVLLGQFRSQYNGLRASINSCQVISFSEEQREHDRVFGGG